MDTRIAKRPCFDIFNDDPEASMGVRAAKRPRFDFFNEDILTEILSRVPVESLIRLRCVCKSWRDLFSSPEFVVKQISRTSSTMLFLTTKIPGKDESTPPYSLDLSALSLFKNDDVNNVVWGIRQHDFSEIFPKHWINIVGSCNGLLCLLANPKGCNSRTFNFVLWNPCTGEIYELPEFNAPVYNWRLKFYGFGYDSTTRDYKVVVLDAYTKIAAVYTTKTGSWRTLEIPVKTVQRAPSSVPFSTRQGLLLKGALHWQYFIYEEGHPTVPISRIMSFDLAKETFEDILPLPNVLRNHLSHSLFCLKQIGTIGNCLVMFVWDRHYGNHREPITIWMMKEYGVEKSWTKLKIPSSSEDLPKGFKWYSVVSISIIDNSLVLMKLKRKKRKKVVLYDPNTGGFKSLSMISPEFSVQATCYVETLASPVADI